jgi:hypothetical protein
MRPILLSALQEELETQALTHRDVHLRYPIAVNVESAFYAHYGESIGAGPRVQISPWAFGQLCNRLGVPAQYMNKCPDDLVADNLNHWVRNPGKNVLLRLKDVENDLPVLRAYLSDKFAPFDNHTLAGVLRSELHISANTQVSVGYDALQFNLEMDVPDLEFDVNDTRFHPGISIENSEVGHNSFKVNFSLRPSQLPVGMIVVHRSEHRHIGRPSRLRRECRALMGYAINHAASLRERVTTKIERLKVFQLDAEGITKFRAKMKEKYHFSDTVENAVTHQIGGSVLSAYELLEKYLFVSNNLSVEESIQVREAVGDIITFNGNAS